VDEWVTGDERRVEVLEETAGFAVAFIDQVVLLRTRKPLQSASLDALFRATTLRMQAYGPRLLYVIIPGALQPSVAPRVEERVAAVWPKVQAQSCAGVVWIRNAGFTAALNRKQLTELSPYVRDRSLLGVATSASETVAYFRSHISELESDCGSWEPAFEEFAGRYD